MFGNKKSVVNDRNDKGKVIVEEDFGSEKVIYEDLEDIHDPRDVQRIVNDVDEDGNEIIEESFGAELPEELLEEDLAPEDYNRRVVQGTNDKPVEFDTMTRPKGKNLKLKKFR